MKKFIVFFILIFLSCSDVSLYYPIDDGPVVVENFNPMDIKTVIFKYKKDTLDDAAFYTIRAFQKTSSPFLDLDTNQIITPQNSLTYKWNYNFSNKIGSLTYTDKNGVIYFPSRISGQNLGYEKNDFSIKELMSREDILFTIQNEYKPCLQQLKDSYKDIWTINGDLFSTNTSYDPLGKDTLISITHGENSGQFSPLKEYKYDYTIDKKDIILDLTKGELYKPFFTLNTFVIPSTSDKSPSFITSAIKVSLEGDPIENIVFTISPTYNPPLEQKVSYKYICYIEIRNSTKYTMDWHIRYFSGDKIVSVKPNDAIYLKPSEESGSKYISPNNLMYKDENISSHIRQIDFTNDQSEDNMSFWGYYDNTCSRDEICYSYNKDKSYLMYFFDTEDKTIHYSYKVIDPTGFPYYNGKIYFEFMPKEERKTGDKFFRIDVLSGN